MGNYFKTFEILVKEDFRRTGESGEGIIEQVDGIVEVDNQIYFVEMKWKKDAISNSDVYQHLGRINYRANARGIFISASGYTSSAIVAAKESLVNNTFVMFDLEEFVKILESEIDFPAYLRLKIQTAIIEKNPYKKN